MYVRYQSTNDRSGDDNEFARGSNISVAEIKEVWVEVNYVDIQNAKGNTAKLQPCELKLEEIYNKVIVEEFSK